MQVKWVMSLLPYLMQRKKTCMTESGLACRTICLRIIAALGAVHFSISLIAWTIAYVVAYREGELRVFSAAHFLTGTVPAVLLFATFSIGLWRTWTHRKKATWIIGMSLLLAASCLWYDASFGEPQWQRVWFEEGRVCSSRENHYCTWWWWSQRIR